MTAETFNEFGSRYGYPIYVFSDGTYASTRISGKQVLFTVEGPIDTNPSHQRQLTTNRGNYPASRPKEEQKTSGFWDRVKQRVNGMFSPTEPEDTNYEEVTDVTYTPKQETSPERWERNGKKGTFTHQGKDWGVRAEGVSEVKTYHAKDGDREVFVANYKF